MIGKGARNRGQVWDDEGSRAAPTPPGCYTPWPAKTTGGASVSIPPRADRHDKTLSGAL